jgi:hypothetical protein
MIREILYGVGGLVLFAYSVDLFLSFSDDPQEPRRLPSRLPLIGHLLGIMRLGPVYYNQMRSDFIFVQTVKK